MQHVLQFQSYGPAEKVLEYVEIEIPSLSKSTQVLIRIKSIGVNQGDCIVRSGKAKHLLHLKLPARVGVDYSGIIEQVGRDVKQFNIGDEVVGQILFSNQGTYAEYLLQDVNSGAIAHKPKNITFEEAASLPMGMITSYEGLVNLCKFKNDGHSHRILIVGASGGVGTFAIGVAKVLGKHVTAICSEKNAEKVKYLGADAVIDYTSKSFRDDILSIEKFDAVFDTVGGDEYYHLLKQCLIPGKGVYCSTVIGSEKFGGDKPFTRIQIFKAIRNIMWRKLFSNTRYELVSTPPFKSFDEIMKWIKQGQVRFPPIETYYLRDGARAMNLQESHRTFGKMVLIP